MTAREKLQKERPDNVRKYTPGGCLGCPHDYGYLSRPDYCHNYDIANRCARCWDREIPDEKKDDAYPSLVDEEDKELPAKKMVYAHIGPFDKPNANGTSFPKGVRLEPSFMIDADGKAKIREVSIVSDQPRILDSGNRREFETGAVRDIQEGKGRCDLLPLDVVAKYIELTYMDDIRGSAIAKVLMELAAFQEDGCDIHLYNALEYGNPFSNIFTMPLEVAIHFEEGAKKYGDNNWQKGIPVRCYIDSAVRHYLKFLRGDKDEPHDRAFCWNIMCAIWTCKHKPELNDYAPKATDIPNLVKKHFHVPENVELPEIAKLSVDEFAKMPRVGGIPVSEDEVGKFLGMKEE